MPAALQVFCNDEEMTVQLFDLYRTSLQFVFFYGEQKKRRVYTSFEHIGRLDVP